MRMPAPRRLAVHCLATGLVVCTALVAAPVGAAGAGPTVAELLAVCERGQAAGGVGVDAALCEWYALPCDCSGKAPDVGPRWCLPDAASPDTALAQVLVALRTEPRQQAAADAVVPDIMVRLYPCPQSAQR